MPMFTTSERQTLKISMQEWSKTGPVIDPDLSRFQLDTLARKQGEQFTRSGQ